MESSDPKLRREEARAAAAGARRVANWLQENHGNDARRFGAEIECVWTREINQDQAAEVAALAMTAAEAFCIRYREALSARGAARWLRAGAEPLIDDALRFGLCRIGLAESSLAGAPTLEPGEFLREGPSVLPAESKRDAWIDRDQAWTEATLAAFDPPSRKQTGAYFTPAAAARLVIKSVDRNLRNELSLPHGLWDPRRRADSSRLESDDLSDRPPARILDPAAGAGVFPLVLFDEARRAVEAEPESLPFENWNDFVADGLLPRLVAMEWTPASLVVARILATVYLSLSGFDFDTDRPLQFVWGDALKRPSMNENTEREPYSVVIGNPPYLASSAAEPDWIRDLTRGRGPSGEARASYFHVGGRPLGERKTWLHDDYVRFLRFAHWQIERSGAGAIGLVTNHGFLDNATFRGLRDALLTTFDRIELIDLHGSRKKKERSPSSSDESLFGIDQGVATIVLTRGATPRERAEARRADVWGTRAEKLAALSAACDDWQSPAWQSLRPCEPVFSFSAESSNDDGGGRGIPITHAMPLIVSAPVTARDAFAVAVTKEELSERLDVFCDSSIPDEVVRERFFQRTRSARYRRGDSRGWKLSQARRQYARMRSEDDLRSCLYRPLDRRFVCWSPRLVDWPRPELTGHLPDDECLSLVVRRRMPPGEPCCYFYVVNGLALDGVIRSDNRGSESLAPLYLLDEKGDASRPNYEPEFLKRIESAIGRLPTPAETFAMIYAQFHAGEYRRRFAGRLRESFPIVFIPADRSVLELFAEFGNRLIDAHLGRSFDSDRLPELEDARPDKSESASDLWVSIPRGFPKLADDRLHFNPTQCLIGVSAATWEYKIGAYRVCQKWLKSRRKRGLSSPDLQRYREVVACVATAVSICDELDQAVEDRGGFLALFPPADG